MQKTILFFAFAMFATISFAQTSAVEDSVNIKKIYDEALLNGKAYEWLEHLSTEIGPRLSGSLGAERAVEYTKQELEKLGLDKVWLQPVMVPKWVRGAKERAYVKTTPGSTRDLKITALGGSVATPDGGTTAKVVEVQGIEELAALGEEKLKGKIVFLTGQ